MTNKKLLDLMREFVAIQPDYDRDSKYSTSKEDAWEIIEGFIAFLREKGVRI